MHISGSGGCLIDKSRKYVLICLENSHPVKNRKWGFPKGRKEFNYIENRIETDEECYIREIYEETGIDLRKELYNVTHKKRINSRRFYKILLKSDKDELKLQIPKNNEILKLKWININELKELVKIYPQDFNSGVRKLCENDFFF